MIVEVPLEALSVLLVTYRVSKRRPNTTSLKWELDPWNVSSIPMRFLIREGYVRYWRIHGWYRWQMGVSEKGEEILSDLDVPKLVLDLFRIGEFPRAGDLILNMTKEELCELLTHPNRTLRDWAQNRFESLTERGV